MSQPFDKGAQCSAPGTPDKELGEFWVGNPWFIPMQENLSAFERNRMYLNVNGTNFVDISHLTSADSNGDGRCAVAADLNNDGRQDLILRQAGGIPLAIFENRLPQKSWLRVSLRGVKSNRLGIGARLIAKTSTGNVVRELYPVNSYVSQSPSIAHFGLGDHESIESLEIRWPSGIVQTVPNVVCGQHIVVMEEGAGYEVVEPGRIFLP